MHPIKDFYGPITLMALVGFGGFVLGYRFRGWMTTADQKLALNK